MIAVNFNPNHDELGRFTSGALGVSRSLTSDEESALNRYRGSYFRGVNASLRGKQQATAATERIIHQIDGAFTAVAPLAYPATVYRGLPGARQLDLNAGDIFTDPGFVSTSLNPHIAEDFVHSADKGFAIIELPKGARVLDMQARLGGGEEEVLLPRGSRFRVAERRGNDLTMELLPRG